MHPLHRLLRHWRGSKKQGRQLFSASDLEHIERIIHDSEPLNHFHVKLAIEVALPTHAVLRKTSARARACAIFAQHHPMHDADYRHIVIYINLADRRVEIINDQATTELFAGDQFHAVCDRITHGFASGDPVGGIVSALHALATLLEKTS